MRENRFIHQNRKKWEECEQNLEQKKPDPDKLSRQFIQVTDDLSFARTFYPNRSVRVYLNQLAAQLYSQVHQQHKQPIRHFWAYTLPLTIYQSRHAFLVSFLTFGLAMVIGMFSYSQDSDFAKVVLGSGYVSMTEENIESGDPMKVYKESQPSPMFLNITLNNIKVALLTFVTGAFFGIGCIAALLSNGIMLGTFQYFFVEKGLFGESFLTLWQHGTLEISAIIMAGAGGLVMSQGLIFPGTYNRLQAFRITAVRGLKIFVGTIPIFVLAAFIEGFYTRYTELPDIVLLTTILLSLAFVLTYFVWYPRKVAISHGLPDVPGGYQIPPQTPYQLSFYRIKSAGQVFNDAIQYIRQNSHFFLKLTTGMAVLQVLALRFIWHPLTNEGAFMDPNNHNGYVENLQVPSFFPIAAIAGILIGWLSHSRLQQSFLRQVQALSPGSAFQVGKRYWAGYLLLAGLSFSLLLIGNGWGYFLFLLSLPLIGVSLFVGFHDREDAIHGLSEGFPYVGNAKTTTFQFFLLLVFIDLFGYLLLDNILVYMYIKNIAWNIPDDASWGPALVYMFMLFLRIAFFNLFLVLVWVGSGLLATSLKEAMDGPDLLKRIQNLKS